MRGEEGWKGRGEGGEEGERGGDRGGGGGEGEGERREGRRGRGERRERGRGRRGRGERRLTDVVEKTMPHVHYMYMYVKNVEEVHVSGSGRTFRNLLN